MHITNIYYLIVSTVKELLPLSQPFLEKAGVSSVGSWTARQVGELGLQFLLLKLHQVSFLLSCGRRRHHLCINNRLSVRHGHLECCKESKI